jgi:hypothetical protein
VKYRSSTGYVAVVPIHGVTLIGDAMRELLS